MTIAIASASCGVALLLAAVRFDAAWFERHSVLTCFWLAPSAWLHPLARALLATAGVCALLVAPVAARPAAVAPVARIAAAVVLALVVSEGALRLLDGKTAFWRAAKIEFRIGKPDPRFGWVLLPRRSTVLQVAGFRAIQYTVDAWGDRADGAEHVPDPSRPTIVLAGESVAAGHGLEYADT